MAPPRLESRDVLGLGKALEGPINPLNNIHKQSERPFLASKKFCTISLGYVQQRVR